MRVVVNHLRLKEPLPQAVVDAADEVCREITAAGGLAASLTRVDETHVVLVLTFPDAETEERIGSELGGPWMREHVLPLLAGPTDRSSGELIAGSL